jgi:fucose permease
MDYTYLMLILIFVLWIYFVELSLNYKQFAFSIAQFIISIPIQIFLASDSYFSGIMFGYVIVMVICFCSLFIIAYNWDETNKKKK